jgi:Bifunctional DNA primase/polymerase, N-terminal
MTKQSVIEAARKFLERGWSVVPVPHKQKSPHLKGWQNLRMKESEIIQYFSEDNNIGILLGEPSGGLVDVDLDCPEAIFLGQSFLTRTGRVHGRESKPRSHFWYRAEPIPEPEKFADPDGTCLLELRSTGQQTIVPPSIHPIGERIEWASKHRSAHVDGLELRSEVARTAAAALLARHWPKKGRRSDAALALAGTLLRAGWEEIEVGEFVSLVAQAANDEEWAARKATARTTRKRLDKDGKVTGRPSLTELMSAAAVDRACEWLGIDLSRPSAEGVRQTEAEWPAPLRERALCGLAGDFVRMVSPQTEADPAAILIQLLVAYGNACGRSPHLKWGRAKHYTNLFSVLVGNTAKSRKGTSWEEVASPLNRVDSEWLRGRVQSGLSSGEGLIWAVRDAIEKSKRNKTTGDIERITEDPGVDDKRLLVLEEEFASALRVIRREGNTLSPVMRNAWSRGDLSSLTKTSPARATEAHISIIGHITRNEVLRELTANEGSNGFANRFLWGCVRRSQYLPFGGKVDSEKLSPWVSRFGKALVFARRTGRMTFSDQSRELWERKYRKLSAEVPGLLGAIISRAEAQVLRLSMVYALLDCSSIVYRKHLRAALAVWRYCEDSARYIFGDSFGDPVADSILRALRKNQKGLTRTEIRELFQRNRTELEINNGLRVLLEHRLVRSEREETGGRPSERWLAVR